MPQTFGSLTTRLRAFSDVLGSVSSSRTAVNLFKQLAQQMFLLNGDHIEEQGCVEDINHVANLTRVAAQCRFKNRCLAVQIRFSDHRQGNMVLPQKILRLDPDQAQHFRNLVEG